jgi:hypothetical protein
MIRQERDGFGAEAISLIKRLVVVVVRTGVIAVPPVWTSSDHRLAVQPSAAAIAIAIAIAIAAVVAGPPTDCISGGQTGIGPAALAS